MTVTTSGGGTNPAGSPSSRGLVVAPDGLTIYEAGSLRQVAIDELVNNPLAIRMLVNDLNQTKQELAEAKKGSIPTPVTLVLAIVSACGVVLVGLGSTYLGMTPEPHGANWVLSIGAIITLASTLTPALMAVVKSIEKIIWRRRQKKPGYIPSEDWRFFQFRDAAYHAASRASQPKDERADT